MKYPLTATARQILDKRYIHTKLGEKSWEDVVERILHHVVPGEEDRFREMLLERFFVPNSPTLVNAGTTIKGYTACFVVPFEDSLEGIAKTKYSFMKIAQKGGGCGTTLSHLRPEGFPVAGSTHSTAGGPVSFYNTICEDMKAMTQAGFREMAMMGTMSIVHPDIEKFITAKEQEGVMHLSNLSVMVPDYFMEMVTEAEPGTYDLALRWNDEVVGYVDATKLFDMIVYHAWLNGEPGILFEDTINNNTPYSHTGQYIYATNPCGEQPLPPYGACNLGSIDLSKFVIDKLDIDWHGLAITIENAVEFLDNIIDISEWPIPEIEDWVLANRPIGLGVMGFADMLLALGIPYGGQKCIDLIHELGIFIHNTAYEKSIQLGVIRGIPEQCKKLPTPRRNITLLSIAPTGSIALIAGCSHSIEPIFAPVTYRQDTTGSYEDHHPLSNRSHFKSAVNGENDKVVHWQEHIDVQATWQTYVDSAVSKTINFPKGTTVEEVREAFIYAWYTKCKGITVYVDGSREQQVLRAEKSLDFPMTRVTYQADRPRILESRTVKLSNNGSGGEGNVYITIGYTDKGSPIEVFVNGPSILLPDVQMRDGFSRLSSLALRYGVPVERLVKELRQIQATSLRSVPTQIAAVLEELELGDKCPNCNANIQFLEGCRVCVMCGYSHCS